jgi:hypothetical protein
MDPVEDLNESNFATLTQYLMASTKDMEVRRGCPFAGALTPAAHVYYHLPQTPPDPDAPLTRMFCMPHVRENSSPS